MKTIWEWRNGEARECQIIKEGRIYYEVKTSEFERLKVNKTTLRYVMKNYPQLNRQFYATAKDIENEMEAKKLWEGLRKIFGSYITKAPVSLDALRKISEIVQNELATK